MTAFHGSADATQLTQFQTAFPNATVQLFDLDRVAGSRHLLLATFNAVKSFDSKRRISRSLGMEILLFVSGTRQISEAVKRVGVTPKTVRTAATTILASSADYSMVADYIAGVLNGKGDDSLLDHWTSLRRSTVVRTFGIGEKELKATLREDEKTEKAIERLAIERSAMLAIAK